MKEWKLKKQDAKAKKELDEKEGKDKATGDKKPDKPKELDSPLMNQAEIEATMAEYEVTTESCMYAHQSAQYRQGKVYVGPSGRYCRSLPRFL